MAKKVKTVEGFSTDLFFQFAETRMSSLREKLISIHQNLARHLANKYAKRGIDIEDLFQEACIGLINAIDRFDPHRGVKFSTYATPTILGEIKRYFRDKGWPLKVSRRTQEVYLKASKATENLRMELFRDPTLLEIAEKIDASEEEIAKALALMAPISLEESRESDEGLKQETGDILGLDDRGFEKVCEHAEIEEALTRIPPRLALILRLRFFEGLSQLKVAERLNVSQMHVCRLQAKALSHLRNILDPEVDVTIERQTKITGQLESLWLLNS